MNTGILVTIAVSLIACAQLAGAGESAEAALSIDEMKDRLLVRVAATEQVPIDDIKVVEATKNVWLDASLGCPGGRRLMGRSQIAGYRFVLQLGERMLEYHTDTLGTIVRCPDPGRPIDRITRSG